MYRPISFHIDFKYKCPNCQSDIWLTQEQVSSLKKYTCHCGVVIPLLNFSHFEVKGKLGQKTPKPQVPPSSINPDYKDRLPAISILAKYLGKKSAQIKVTEIVSQNHKISNEDLIRVCLAGEK